MSTHLDRSSPTVATSPSPAPSSAASASSRSRRHRGLSLLRSYTHSHLLHHSHHNNTASNAPAPHRANTFSRSVTSPDLRAARSEHPTTAGGSDETPDRKERESSGDTPGGQNGLALSPPQSPGGSGSGGTAGGDSSTSTSGWLPTVGGQRGLSRVASQPQSSSTASPPAELLGAASLPDAGSNLSGSMGRKKHETVPLGARSTAPASYSSAARDFARLDFGSSGSDVNNASNADTSLDGAPPPPDVSESQLGSSETAESNGLVQSQMPSIRFTPHQDPRSSRPSLAFAPISRTLPSGSSVIRVGRYSEKESVSNTNPNSPSAAPIGFKSKVVSRRHCEFWCANGQWYIKDVKSSSGTFLNHIRLSTAAVESRPWPVNDGDVVQLGIDFKGGEEMIFRCVKIRVECNRGWQKALNSFNTTTHKRLRNLAQNRKTDNETTSTHASECSICLFSIAPCQSLFVAPCSHVWHYKCIRPILMGHMYPQFLCPNCRAVADLEAEVDEPFEDWEEEIEEARKSIEQSGELVSTSNEHSDTSLGHEIPQASTVRNDDDLARLINGVFLDHGGEIAQGSSRAQSISEKRSSGSISSQNSSRLGHPPPIDIASRSTSGSAPIGIARQGENGTAPDLSRPRTSSAQEAPNALLPDVNSPEGPMTPRNDAGPFVFDGSAGGASTPGRPPPEQALVANSSVP